jgi:hypothetical protein
MEVDRMETPYKITIECEKEKDRDKIFVEAAKIIKKLSNERKLEGAVKY